MGTGDRPIFPLLNQRLDKKDLNLVSTYIQETISRSLGSIFSGNGGLLSKLEYSLAYNSPTEVAVSFLAFRAAWSAPLDGDPSVYDGGVMTYDPTRPAQVTSSWPIEAFQGLGTIFWAKRDASFNAVTDNRAYWQGGTKYAATQTIESEYVEIVPRLATAGPPDAEFGWVQIAYIQTSGWTGFTPTIRGIYFPDSKFFPTGAGPGWDNWWSLYDPGAGDVGHALGDQLRWVFNVLSRFNDSNWVFHEDGRVDSDNNNGTVGWQEAPTKGFLQVNNTLTVHENELGDHEDRITILEGADPLSPLVRETLVLEFRWNAGTTDYDKVVVYDNGWLTSSHTTTQRGTLGVDFGVSLTLTSTGSGAYTIYGITVQGVTEAADLPATSALSDRTALLCYADGALPATSLVAVMHSVDTPRIHRMLVRVTAGLTP